jgi:glycosyltransferase involved in cell wall biosynthesis
MELKPEHITIAVTVYNRRDFVQEAIRSALVQTVPVKVVVVEDCGSDSSIRNLIVGKFGNRIEYFRNPRNRGLFDNWNACMEYCRTPWMSVLHDDDLLHPNFVETMLALAKTAPGRALYFGRSGQLDEDGRGCSAPAVSWGKSWRDIDPIEFAEHCFVMFPGQLFRVAAVRDIGGFRPVSYFTGDWDLWFRLALRFGAAQTATEISTVRSHYGQDRGTSRVERMGWKWALDNVQRKRNLALLEREKGMVIPFERTKLLEQSPIPSRVLLRYARGYSRRILAYNAWLFLHSKPPHWRYAGLQWLVRLFGPEILRASSILLSRVLNSGLPAN